MRGFNRNQLTQFEGIPLGTHPLIDMLNVYEANSIVLRDANGVSFEIGILAAGALDFLLSDDEITIKRFSKECTDLNILKIYRVIKFEEQGDGVTDCKLSRGVLYDKTKVIATHRTPTTFGCTPDCGYLLTTFEKRKFE